MRKNIAVIFLLTVLFCGIKINSVAATSVSQEVTAATTVVTSENGPVMPYPNPPIRRVVPPVVPVTPEATPAAPEATPVTPSVPVPPPPIASLPSAPVLSPETETPGGTVPTTITNVVSEITGGLATTVKSVLREAKDIIVSPIGRTVSGVVAPIGVISGIAMIVVQAILSTATLTVTSFADIYLLAWRMLGLLFGASKKRGKPWGTVYDAVTKRPLDPAYVVVSKETGEEVADAITDLDGRYGFLIPSGRYLLKASKTNYEFPTRVLSGRTSDELYDNIYHGEAVETKEGEVVVKNIPLDPIGFDWNEFAKNKQNLFRIYSDREKFWRRLFGIFYLIGFLSAVVATIFDPRKINFIFLGLYLIFMAYNYFSQERRRAVSVKRLGGLEPIPFAIIKVFFAGLENQAKTAVADHLGRFYFLVGPGSYYLTVDEKKEDGSYERIYKSAPMELPHGVLLNDVIVP